ncbi:MAG: hypothetical protein C5S44_07435 [Candidatus Methanocomedens sp.]|jgi:hypothetical protein|nr:MAG: hypothetical protein C5S44_07435 [ANME-2 cluster archaeon]
MLKVLDFNQDEYKQAMNKYGNSRRGVRAETLYELLDNVKPGDMASSELTYLLDKRCNTNPSASWGSCIKAAKDIRRILFDK